MTARSVGVTVLPEFFQNRGGRARSRQSPVPCRRHRHRHLTLCDAACAGWDRQPGASNRWRRGIRAPARPRTLGATRIVGTHRAKLRARQSHRTRGCATSRREPDDLTHSAGRSCRRGDPSAKARGLEVHLQVQAAIPPGYRVQFGGPVDEDRPSLPDGSSPVIRVDNNGSLASPHILAYTQALIRDTIGAYPDIDVLRIDWPEYPPYSLDALFFDFSPARHRRDAGPRVRPRHDRARRGRVARRSGAAAQWRCRPGERRRPLLHSRAWFGAAWAVGLAARQGDDCHPLHRGMCGDRIRGFRRPRETDAPSVSAAVDDAVRVRLCGCRANWRMRHRRQALHDALADDPAQLWQFARLPRAGACLRCRPCGQPRKASRDCG